MKSKRLHPNADKHPKNVESLYPDLCQGEGLLGIVITAELLAMLIVMVRGGLEDVSWFALGQTSLMALWITLLGVGVLCVNRESLTRHSRRFAAILSFTYILLVTAMVSSVGQLLLNWAHGRELFDIDAWMLIEHSVVAAIPAVILLRHMYLQHQLRIQQRAETEARIQALQSRIRPHFLFNSMNIIASLIATDPEKAESVVEDLADLFRHALTDNHTLVPLREELSLCRRYMSIEKLRLGDRLHTVWQIDDYGTNVQIPSLTLQPVLENAVYHGVQLLPEGGEIAINVSRRKSRIVIRVRNPRNLRMQHNRGNKMAMDNVRTRLRAHFGDTADIRARIDDNCYITQISYPVATE